MKVTIESSLHGVHWFIHEHDEDINRPSCPHCHAKEKNWKLDIYTGNIYDYTNGETYIGILSKREMKKLWHQKGFIELVLRERKWYEEVYHSKNPERYPPLPTIRVSEKHRKQYVTISTGWYRQVKRK